MLNEPKDRANWLLFILALPLSVYLLAHWLLPWDGLEAAARLPWLRWLVGLGCQVGDWGERLLTPLFPLVTLAVLGKPAAGQLVPARLRARYGLADRSRYGNLYRLVERLAMALGVPVPTLIVVPGRVRASLCGFRPVLVLSSALLDALSEEELSGVLAHELAHLKRRDYLLRPLAGILRGLMFFAPAAHRALAALELEQEKATDDLAVAVSGNRLLYGATLIKVWRLQQEAPPWPAVPGLTLGFASGSLALRVERLLEVPAAPARQSGRTIWSYGLPALSIVALLLISC